MFSSGNTCVTKNVSSVGKNSSLDVCPVLDVDPVNVKVTSVSDEPKGISSVVKVERSVSSDFVGVSSKCKVQPNVSSNTRVNSSVFEDVMFVGDHVVDYPGTSSHVDTSCSSLFEGCVETISKQWLLEFCLLSESESENSKLYGIFDTGSSLSYVDDVRANIFKSLGFRPKRVKSFNAEVANSEKVNISEVFDIPLCLRNRKFVFRFYHLSSLSFGLLFGLDSIVKSRMCVSAADDSWFFEDDPRVKIKFLLKVPKGTSQPLCGISPLSETEREVMDKLVHEGVKLVDSSKNFNSRVSHKIVIDDVAPIKQKAYQYSPKVLEVLNTELDKLLDNDFVEPCNSPWASPVVMVRKNDSYRFCIDFRRLNAITRKDSYPLPNMTYLLDSLRQARYLSKIDLRQAFHQVPLVDELSKDLTAFIVPGRGLFRYKVMPFGLTNAPATFQRLADSIFGPEFYPHVVVFLDDILVCSSDFKTHCRLLREVFSRLSSAGLKINPDKCEFGCREVKYLGFRVNESGLTTDPEKVDSVVTFPSPINVKQLRTFLGMAGWYRRFVSDFSTIVAPLTKLLKKRISWSWTDEQENSFQKLKTVLSSAPILARPNFTLPFVLQTDASNTGLGAVLTQIQDGEERVIAYSSRTLSRTEQNYSVTEKECLAVLFGIERNRHYLEGYTFTVITDHASLKWLLNLKNPTGRLARWSLRLQPFDFKIEYRKGKLNAVADALSRIPDTANVNLVATATNVEGPQDHWYDRKFYRVENFPDVHPDWKVDNSQLYYFHKSFLKGELLDPSEDWKLVVPLKAREEIIRSCHDNVKSGHLGVEKTHWRVGRLYYWPNMFSDIAKYIGRCDVCQKVKPPNRAQYGKMFPRYLTTPWEIVSTDMIGPMPRSKSGNVYILVFQDLFSKWVEIVPIRKATSAVIIKKFRSRVLNRFGCPKILLSDNAKNYIGKLVKDLATECNIELRNTPLYHSQANPTERSNRNIRQLIVTYLKSNHQEWDLNLGEIQFALNSVVQDSTKFSPAYLNFGRELRTGEEVRVDEPVPVTISSDVEKSSIQEWSVRIAKLRESFNVAEQNLLKAGLSQSAQYNMRRRVPYFKVGDRVLRKSIHLSSAVEKIASKLYPYYEGPFIVIEVSRVGVCTLETLDGRNAGVWHPSKLKPYIS